jgi:hypothetical protein
MTPLERLRTIANENPNRAQTVIQIEIQTISDTQEGEEIPASIEGGLAPTPLEPPGPLALYLWKTDPEFRAATAAVRRTILRDWIVKVTERVDTELRGSRWCRKKVLEQLAAQQTAAVSPPMDTPELDAALCHLFGYQKVVVDEAGKKVRFFPADPRTWSAELPIWGSTTGGRAVLHRSDESSIACGLARWLTDRESGGWRVDWPEADGTLEAIKKTMVARGIGCGPRLEKPKKADWALALGRADTITKLAELEALR